MRNTIIIIGSIIFIIFCFACENINTSQIETNNIDTLISEQAETIDSAIEYSMNYLSNWDLDGDGINDEISFDYTEGAHCCHIISIILSSDTILREFPFEMDGGYVFDVDDSQPNHFNIKDYDNDGLPEIFMEIATYNGVPYDIPIEWTEKFHFTSHYILFDYFENNLIIKDYVKPENNDTS